MQSAELTLFIANKMSNLASEIAETESQETEGMTEDQEYPEAPLDRHQGTSQGTSESLDFQTEVPLDHRQETIEKGISEETISQEISEETISQEISEETISQKRRSL
jgi:hypothetical protein